MTHSWTNTSLHKTGKMQVCTILWVNMVNPSMTHTWKNPSIAQYMCKGI